MLQEDHETDDKQQKIFNNNNEFQEDEFNFIKHELNIPNNLNDKSKLNNDSNIKTRIAISVNKLFSIIGFSSKYQIFLSVLLYFTSIITLFTTQNYALMQNLPYVIVEKTSNHIYDLKQGLINSERAYLQNSINLKDSQDIINKNISINNNLDNLFEDYVLPYEENNDDYTTNISDNFYYDSNIIFSGKLNYTYCDKSKYKISIDYSKTPKNWILDFNIYCNQLEVSLIGTLFIIGCIFGAVVVLIGNYIGRKNTWLSCLVLFIPGTILILVFESKYCLFVSCFIFGLVQSIFIPLKSVILSENMDSHFRSIIISITMTASVVDSMLTYFLYNDFFSWKIQYIVLMCCCFILIILVMRYTVESPKFYYNNTSKLLKSANYISRFNNRYIDINENNFLSIVHEYENANSDSYFNDSYIESSKSETLSSASNGSKDENIFNKKLIETVEVTDNCGEKEEVYNEYDCYDDNNDCNMGSDKFSFVIENISGNDSKNKENNDNKIIINTHDSTNLNLNNGNKDCKISSNKKSKEIIEIDEINEINEINDNSETKKAGNSIATESKLPSKAEREVKEEEIEKKEETDLIGLKQIKNINDIENNNKASIISNNNNKSKYMKSHITNHKSKLNIKQSSSQILETKDFTKKLISFILLLTSSATQYFLVLSEIRSYPKNNFYYFFGLISIPFYFIIGYFSNVIGRKSTTLFCYATIILLNVGNYFVSKTKLLSFIIFSVKRVFIFIVQAPFYTLQAESFTTKDRIKAMTITSLVSLIISSFSSSIYEYYSDSIEIINVFFGLLGIVVLGGFIEETNNLIVY